MTTAPDIRTMEAHVRHGHRHHPRMGSHLFHPSGHPLS